MQASKVKTDEGYQEIVDRLVQELNLAAPQILATVELLDEGATVPFIARYRKEATGALDETVIMDIRDRLAQLRALDKRREAILKSLQERGQLTDELQAKILQADTMAILEDLYLPYRPKRRTRATIAREKGLEPLAESLFEQSPELDPAAAAAAFIDPEKEVATEDDALAGARDIIAEWINENAEARTALRRLFLEQGQIHSRVIPGKEDAAIQYRDYYDWQEPLGQAPSHRVLAARRGENEEFLIVRIFPDEARALAILEALLVKGQSAAAEQVRMAAQDGYRRLLAPSLETEMRQWGKKRADREAIAIFADNLRHLLMAAPLGRKRVLAIDPGFRTGCKTVCLDPQGQLLHHETIFPHTGAQAAQKAAERVLALTEQFRIEAIAIGNGTAGRETESFVRGLNLDSAIQVVMVAESGASVYSASQVARDEFPDQDVTVRGAISIGRRLMDPLAELVKIDPKSIGVGQYQHDVDQGELKNGLDDVVMSCVNAVGVEVNTASAQLLAYVSGLGPQLAQNIVAHRNAHGAFSSRQELKKVHRLGPKAFQQAAGFLRIRDGKNPLDASAVHPEAYGIVEAMARDLDASVADLVGDAALRKQIDPARYVGEEIGLPTLSDILTELAKPGRDPRVSFESFAFAPGIEKIEDLQPNLRLPGIVTNVTAFGAFVDIGVHRDGLVHISELSDRFVNDPRQVVRVQQQVMVTVLEVDQERKRISLSMKTQAGAAGTAEASGAQPTAAQAAPGKPRSKRSDAKQDQPQKPKQKQNQKQKQKKAPKGFNNPFAEAFKDL